MATTVTADDVYGQPGYYLFDGLIPGLRYFVQFVRPASATAFTTPNAGGDTTVDSDARLTDGATADVTLAPGEVNRTIDAGLITAGGTLALGDQVWMDTDNDGVYEPENGEMGIDGVRLNLYLDANGDGLPTLDEYSGTTISSTVSGFVGRYRFTGLAPGNYIVVVDPGSFGGGGALSGKVSSTGNDPAPDPDDDVNGDDNGTPAGALTASHPVTLTDNGEPTSEDGDNDTNLTVDFGFIAGGGAGPATPRYDYGDAPDVTAGTAPGDYNTTALDNGAAHLLGVSNAPYLGACVDADGGFNQNPAASGDDLATSDLVIGTCRRRRRRGRRHLQRSVRPRRHGHLHGHRRRALGLRPQRLGGLERQRHLRRLGRRADRGRYHRLRGRPLRCCRRPCRRGRSRA